MGMGMGMGKVRWRWGFEGGTGRALLYIDIDIGLSGGTCRGILTALNGHQRKGQNKDSHRFIDLIGVFHLDQAPPKPGTDCC